MNYILHGLLLALLYSACFAGAITLAFSWVHHAAGFQYKFKWLRVFGILLLCAFSGLTLVNIIVWTLL